MEILRQHPGRLDAIFVPVGGGGLIAGIAAYVKYLRPEIKVIGVEPDDSNCLQAAMAAGERVVERDTLTPLYNRRYFINAVNDRLKRLGRYGTRSILEIGRASCRERVCQYV